MTRHLERHPDVAPAPCPIVTFIAGHTGMAADMLQRHVDDGSGHCAGCAWQQATRPTFPCVIRHYAALAIDLGRPVFSGPMQLPIEHCR